MALSNAQLITELYIGYFNRAPDPVGLQYWINGMNNGVTFEQIADQFAKSSESTGIYPFLTLPDVVSPDSFIKQVYLNVLGREAEPAGLAYWKAALQNGVVTPGNFIATIIETVNKQTGTADALTLQHKLDVAEYYTKEIANANIPFTQADAKAALAGVDSTDASVALGKAKVDATVQGGTPGDTYTLTTGTDTFTGTAGADTFNAPVAVVIDPSNGNQSNVNTMQSVDTLNGGGGIDTLNFTSKGGAVALPTLNSIEVINGQGLGALTIDASAVSGVTNLNITKVGGALAATAAATTDVNVGIKAAGASVGVDGGKAVTVNVTDVAGAANAIAVGATTAAAGDVSVTSTGAAYTTSTANTTLGAISVTGGSAITVVQKAAADTAAAAADTSNTTITEGTVTIVGNANTASVSVSQDATVAATNATYKTGGVTETASVKFGALKSGDVLEVAGLTFTAGKDLSAAEVAKTFANLIKGDAYNAPASIAAGDTQSGGIAANGTYTLVGAGWTSGAASGDTVVFTSTTANTDVGNLSPTLTNTSGSSVAPVVTTTAGKANDAGAAGGVMGVTAGVVSITDTNATIKTITLDGYGTGSSTSSTSVLETLNLSQAAAAATLTVADTAATLALNLEKIGTKAGDAVVTITSAPTTLNVKSTGDNYVNLTAALTETLNVSGTGILKADATDLAALKAVTVTGAAGLLLNSAVSNTVTSVDTTGTTGAVSVTIDGSSATYAGGSGIDTVTLATTAALTKSIDLGAGNDTLSFGALAVTGSTATVSGGDGTDTLSMTVAAANSLDGSKQSFYTNFEHLTLSDLYSGVTADTQETLTLDLANLGFTNYVTTSGTLIDATNRLGESDILVLDKMASGGTVVLTADGLIKVNVADAATGTADVLNVVLSSTSSLAAGNLTASDVESVKISVVDTEVPNPTVTKNSDTLTLTADKATSVSVDGTGDLTLTLTGSTKVTSIDASSLTGALTVTSLNTTSATTIMGGSGNDVLTAASGSTADVLIGGAGNDVLVANSGLDTLTGGAGNDVFHIGSASVNVNSYATITDFGAGDLLQFSSASAFTSAKVSLGSTAVFQDYANFAINASSTGDVSWFQYGGDTYVVDNLSGTNVFTNGTDLIVKLTGLVDLSNASFNDTYNTIALA